MLPGDMLILKRYYFSYNLFVTTPSYHQGEYDIALVDGEGSQLYFGSFSLSQVMLKFACSRSCCSHSSSICNVFTQSTGNNGVSFLSYSFKCRTLKCCASRQEASSRALKSPTTTQLSRIFGFFWNIPLNSSWRWVLSRIFWESLLFMFFFLTNPC